MIDILLLVMQQPPQQPSQPAIMQAVSPPVSGQYTRPAQPPPPSQPPQNFTTADFQVFTLLILCATDSYSRRPFSELKIFFRYYLLNSCNIFYMKVNKLTMV